MGSTTKKLVWFKNLYSVFIFSIQKVGFEYKKWKHLFIVFIFIENEYNGNFVNIEKYKGPHMIDVSVCKWKKVTFKKKKNRKQCQICVWCILYPNYVFKTIYQIMFMSTYLINIHQKDVLNLLRILRTAYIESVWDTEWSFRFRCL